MNKTLLACWLSIVITSLSVNVCAYQLTPTHYNQLPNWQKADKTLAFQALKRSCRQIVRLAKYRSVKKDSRMSIAWQTSCKAINHASGSLSNQRIQYLIEKNYQPYKVSTHGTQYGLFTGYYQPAILGSLTRTRYFNVPIYGRPNHLVRTKINGSNAFRLRTNNGYVRLPSRADIEKGPILANTPVLAWVHSKVDRFFLQIQGSGSIILPNKKQLLLGYDSQNGHAYYAIGNYLINNNLVPKEKISMQTIVAWLNANPKKAQKVMNMNASFVFFRKLKGQAVVGSIGIPLTPRVSLAIDRHLIPYGAPIWLDTYLPKVKDHHVIRGENFDALMVSQDTGGAIKGAIRGDVFWGEGKKAAFYAGHMKSKGRYWLLLPRGFKVSRLT